MAVPDLAGAYAEARRSMTKIARDLPSDQLAARVPACPGWTVKDLITHVTSIATGVVVSRFEQGLNLAMVWDPVVTERRELFVDGEIEARRSHTLERILDEWEERGGDLEAMLRGERPFPPAAPPLADWIVVTDIGVHHHDLRGAVGMPGDRDSKATGLSLRSYVEGMRMRSRFEERPAFRMCAGTREWVIGDGEPVATVTADPFELGRAVSGRRNPGQIRAYAWTGDPSPFIDLFYPYGPRSNALVE